jgi:hypothetical protein
MERLKQSRNGLNRHSTTLQNALLGGRTSIVLWYRFAFCIMFSCVC